MSVTLEQFGKLSLAILVILFVTCAGPKKNAVRDTCVPQWFLDVPKDPNFFYAASTNISADSLCALKKAASSSRAEIAMQVQLYIKKVFRKILEEIGNVENPNFNQDHSFLIHTDSIALLASKECKIIEKHVCKNEDGFQAYVLSIFPIYEVDIALLKRIQKNKILYDRIRSLKTYRELVKRVQKLDEK